MLFIWFIYMFRCYVMKLDNLYMYVLFSFDDVASISRIYFYIRAFYRLLEVGCYKFVSEPWSVLSRPKPVEFPVCMRHVRKYCRYLLCCSVLSGGFERSGGVAGCFRFVGFGKGRYLWLRRLSCLWFVLRFTLILSWILCVFR